MESTLISSSKRIWILFIVFWTLCILFCKFLYRFNHLNDLVRVTGNLRPKNFGLRVEVTNRQNVLVCCIISLLILLKINSCKISIDQVRTQIIHYEVPMFVGKYVFSIILNTTEHMTCNVKYKILMRVSGQRKCVTWKPKCKFCFII